MFVNTKQGCKFICGFRPILIYLLMKKLVLILISIFTLSAVYGQNPKVVATFNYLKSQQYKKAKEAIDQATMHEKTMNSAKTWWYNGQTYHAINDMCMYQNDQSYCELAPDAATIALNSFIKALVLNLSDPKWHSLDILNNDADAQVFFRLIQDKKNIDNYEITGDILMKRFPPLANVFVNKGVKEYQAENNVELNKEAVKSFETSLFLSGLMKIDTTIYYYTGLAAERVGMWDKAVEYYEKSIELNYGKDDEEKVAVYYGLARGDLMLGDTATYIDYLKKGIEKFPDASNPLVTELINYYLENEMTKEALAYLEIAIQRVPDNYSYYYAQGSLHDKMGEFEKAESSYKKSLELDPNYFDSNYNLGAIYYNSAVSYFNAANDIPPDKQKEYELMIEKAKNELKKALPYLEKAHEIKADDIVTMQSLKEIYVRLQMYDKSKEMKQKLEAL